MSIIKRTDDRVTHFFQKINGYSLKKNNEKFFTLLYLTLAVLLLYPRLNGCDLFAGEYLWAEDGPVFLQEANDFGIFAILHPYAGYLHIYPRIVAFFANHFELVHRPIIFLTGWLIAYLFMMAVILNRARLVDLGLTPVLFLISMIGLQPNYGENFFNITNAQWMLGTGLSFILLIDEGELSQFTIKKLLLLLGLGLTGPFSVLLLPILVLKTMIFQDFKKNRCQYLIILGCAFIQIYFLMNSNRGQGVMNLKPWDWILAFLQLAFFGANSISSTFMAILFWILFIYLLFENWFNQGAKPNIKLIPILTSVAAASFIFGGLYGCDKTNPMAVVILGAGSRYTWVPYCLIFFAALTAANKRPYIQILLFASMSIICYENFQPLKLSNLQFKSFANFMHYRNVIIPLNPGWAAFPSWHIRADWKADQQSKKITINDLGLEDFSVSNATLKKSSAGLRIESDSSSANISQKRIIDCEDSTDIGVEIQMNRNSGGWMQLFWRGDQQFTEENSITRWYPEGKISAQFAFPNISKGFYIRFDPLRVPGYADISKFSVFCLP